MLIPWIRPRIRLASVAFAAASLAGPSSAAPDPGPAAGPSVLTVYVGSYSPADRPGIHQLRLDPATGALEAVGRTTGVANPSFLAVHPSRRTLYAASEVSAFEGRKTGVVVAFSIDAKTGTLTRLNHQPSEGAGPCHLSVDASGRHLFVANYGGGTAAVLPIGPDGRLEAASSVVRHRGSSVNKSRQEGPHAHSIGLDRAGRFALVADLGLDKVMVYRFDPRGTLVPAAPPSAALPPGAGPRHLAVSPKGDFVYAVNELASTVTAFAYDAATGALHALENVSTRPPGFQGENYPAEIATSADGRFLYASNRGHDSIVSFAVDAASGRLRTLGHTPTGGSWPRHFAIDPTGTFLLAANQRSDSVVVLRIDARTGALSPTGQRIDLPKPACVIVRPEAR